MKGEKMEEEEGARGKGGKGGVRGWGAGGWERTACNGSGRSCLPLWLSRSRIGSLPQMQSETLLRTPSPQAVKVAVLLRACSVGQVFTSTEQCGAEEGGASWPSDHFGGRSGMALARVTSAHCRRRCQRCSKQKTNGGKECGEKNKKKTRIKTEEIQCCIRR